MKKLTKRDFFRGVGFFSLIAFFMPWLNRQEKDVETRSYPMKAARDPRAVVRQRDFV